MVDGVVVGSRLDPASSLRATTQSAVAAPGHWHPTGIPSIFDLLPGKDRAPAIFRVVSPIN